MLWFSLEQHALGSPEDLEKRQPLTMSGRLVSRRQEAQGLDNQVTEHRNSLYIPPGVVGPL